ncbi:MAG: sulfurtransferase TusA family protein [Candidatus Heimdallarchaeota archaeon]|nr:sulfurtransferase TusA family protein [Candidatus Heimdallarchaeota archaeon]
MDVRGLPCPIPSIRMQSMLLKIPIGMILRVICSNKNSYNSILKFCNNKGYNLLLTDEKNGEYIYYIRK